VNRSHCESFKPCCCNFTKCCAVIKLNRDDARRRTSYAVIFSDGEEEN
jgi:hypothetical protein